MATIAHYQRIFHMSILPSVWPGKIYGLPSVLFPFLIGVACSPSAHGSGGRFPFARRQDLFHHPYGRTEVRSCPNGHHQNDESLQT